MTWIQAETQYHTETPEVTMYQGMAAKLTLTADDGCTGTSFQVDDATASHGDCKMTGNELLYTPNKDFVGTDVVAYNATDKDQKATAKSLIVHVLPLPKGLEAGGVRSHGAEWTGHLCHGRAHGHRHL